MLVYSYSINRLKLLRKILLYRLFHVMQEQRRGNNKKKIKNRKLIETGENTWATKENRNWETYFDG